MEKIRYINPSKSEVIGRCGGDENKRMTTQNRQNSKAKKNKTYINRCLRFEKYTFAIYIIRRYTIFVQVTNSEST